MRHKKSKKRPDDLTRASVKKEMAKPRIANSARIAERNLLTTRVPERPSTILAGTVDKIIPADHPNRPEKAQIAVDGAEHQHRNIRIENTLTDENGNDVKLKKGARVGVTITADEHEHDP